MVADQAGSDVDGRVGERTGVRAESRAVRYQGADIGDRASYAAAVRGAGADLTPDVIRLPPERVRHILDGDRWGGGHRHGTGRPGKAEFPASWDDERTIGHIMDVARNPDAQPVWQPNHRWRLRGGSPAGSGRPISTGCGRWPGPASGGSWSTCWWPASA